MKISQKTIVASGATLFTLAFVIMLSQSLDNAMTSDYSILTRTSCEFPCWHGIIPGISLLTDVQEVIKVDPFIISSGNIQQGTDGLGRTVFHWWYERSQQGNRIVVDDVNVYSIEVVPNITFTLEDIINLYGPPPAVNSRVETANEGGWIDALLFLYYPEIGAEIEFRIEGGNTLSVNQFEVSPNTSGTRFKLYEPQSRIDDFVSGIYQLYGQELDHFLENLEYQWTGFDALILINPDGSAFYDQTILVTRAPLVPQ